MKQVHLLALAAIVCHISFAPPARGQEPPLSPRWERALETVDRDNQRLGTMWKVPDARARSWALTAGFLYPLARNLDRQGADVSEDVEYMVGHHPDAVPRDPNDPNSPLVLRERRSTATESGAVALLTDAAQGLTLPHGLDTSNQGRVGNALRDYGRAMNAAPVDARGRYRDVTGRAHTHFVEALSVQAAAVQGPDDYEAGPDGRYSREALLAMAADRHFLAQVQGQVWSTSFGNYLQTARELHDVQLTPEQAERFEASKDVEAELTRVLRQAGVLDFEGGRYVNEALPPALDPGAEVPPTSDGSGPGPFGVPNS